jgi:eukaryotic-like serine/threonine-protein kinase
MATCPKCMTHHPDGTARCPTDGSALVSDSVYEGADKDLSPGQMVGEYQIEGKLGEGGFGAVFRAVHPLIGKAAAIKVLNRQFSSDPQMISRFIAEARAVNQIRHRNIIDIFAFGRLEDGRQYYVMELLDGVTLDSYLKSKGRLGVQEAVGILKQVARALDAAHAHGIAHRDLKPENIFLSFDDDGAPYPKLLDFGIAKLMEEGGAAHKTRTGVPIGTPHYMSPEQCRGVNVDHRTDVYSFGALAFELVTGKVPFGGNTLMDVLLKQTTQPAPAPTSVCPDLPASIDAPILAMLEKEPEKRPQSVGAAIDKLAVAAGMTVAPRTAPLGTAPVQIAPASSKMTPADLQAMAEAGTMVELPNTGAAFAAAAQPPASRARLWVGIGAALGLAAVIAVVVVALRPGSSTSATAPAVSSQALVQTQAPSAPSATPSAAPAAAAEVAITIQSVPDKVEVYQGEELLGTAPGPIKLKRGQDKIKLTFKAKGYKPSDMEVAPTADVVLSVSLSKAAVVTGGKTPKKAGGGELENPF